VVQPQILDRDVHRLGRARRVEAFALDADALAAAQEEQIEL
jgi:hypothetical protein